MAATLRVAGPPARKGTYFARRSGFWAVEVVFEYGRLGFGAPFCSRWGGVTDPRTYPGTTVNRIFLTGPTLWLVSVALMIAT